MCWVTLRVFPCGTHKEVYQGVEYCKDKKESRVACDSPDVVEVSSTIACLYCGQATATE